MARRPEVPALLAELGLAARQVGTTGVRPLIFSGGRLHPMPEGTLQGIPAHASAVAGLVDDATVSRVDGEPARPFSWRPGADPTVAELVGDRFGAQVVARSVDPLLAGVYAGSAATIGLRSAVPTLAAALDRGAPNLTDAVRGKPCRRRWQVRCSAPSTVATGSCSTSSFGGHDFHWAHVAVERVERAAGGWTLVDDEGAGWQADAVVLARPRSAIVPTGRTRGTANGGCGQPDSGGVVGAGGVGPSGRDAAARAVGRAGRQRRTVARQGDDADVAQMGWPRQRRVDAPVVRQVRRRSRPQRRRRGTAEVGR